MSPVAAEVRKRKLSPERDIKNADAGSQEPNTMKPKPAKKPKVSKRRYKNKVTDKTSPQGVLQFEIAELLKEHELTQDQTANNIDRVLNDPSAEDIYHRLVSDVKILKLTSNGDGLALVPHPDPEFKGGKFQACVIPFGLPGDVCTVRVFKTHPSYVELDLLLVQSNGEYRDDSLINCDYFGKCSGCQYQNVDHAQQLVFKRQTIENAFKHFAPNILSILPSVLETQPSPSQYNYRTKLTPHFNVPNSRRHTGLETRPSVGFASKGRGTWRPMAGGSELIIDIEECAIGTKIINRGMKVEREKFDEEFTKYKKAATILLREDTRNASSPTALDGPNEKVESVVNGTNIITTYTTDPREIVREFVDGNWFEFSAGEFFQNNNAILPIILEYVRSNLNLSKDRESYLVDAYCGLGLFSILCAAGVRSVIGVEISADSIKFAERNAEANKIENAKFIVGKAEAIFQSIESPCDQTLVILDPPRKGCDQVFLNQLLAYYPARIVYISCNVHSQARDIDWFLTNTERGKDYEVTSIKGFDFFPQTHHVESVAVLLRRSN